MTAPVDHACCRCALRLRVFIEKDGLPAIIRGAIKGMMSEKKRDHLQGDEVGSITKRLVGQVRSELLAALNGQPPMRHRFDPYKQHCRSCSCGAGAMAALEKIGIRAEAEPGTHRLLGVDRSSTEPGAQDRSAVEP